MTTQRVTPKGDQPRFERGREGMEPAVCDQAAGRGTDGAPAIATLPHYASPVGGPMGDRQPAAAGPAGAKVTRPALRYHGAKLTPADVQRLREYLDKMGGPQ